MKIIIAGRKICIHLTDGCCINEDPSIAQLSILPISRTTMYVRILITVTVCHSKRGMRHTFMGHACYKRLRTTKKRLSFHANFAYNISMKGK